MESGIPGSAPHGYVQRLEEVCHDRKGGGREVR